ncbi:MAG: LamG domain-containing protein, partial [Planctomycetota bacterium]
MCRKLIYSFSVFLVLTGTARGELIGWWKFDEGSGTTAYDSSGNGNDGTLIGNPQWVAGKIGGALDFNGTDSIIDIPYSPDMTPSDGTTMSAWVFPTDTSRACIVGQFEGYGMALNTGLQLKSVIWGADWILSDVTIPTEEWSHIAMTWDVTNGERMIFLNGELVGQRPDSAVPTVQNNLGIGLWVGWPAAWGDDSFMGIIDDVQVHNIVLTEDEIVVVMKGEGYPYAVGPKPKDGDLHMDTWVNLSWSPGDYAVSHDVYLGDNFDDVDNATVDSPVFQGNQTDAFLVAGFPGFAFPDGLVPGTTYYWRIDEVNDTEPNSPWKGNIWSFSVPPKTAYNPAPADGAEFVDLDATFTWTPGFGAKIHTVYFGEDFDEVNNATGGMPLGGASYTPAVLESEKVYYWRVDEFDAVETHKGDVWAFTTPGAVGNPQPANGAVDVQMIATLSWTPADKANSHELYFGTDADAVKSATTAS